MHVRWRALSFLAAGQQEVSWASSQITLLCTFPHLNTRMRLRDDASRDGRVPNAICSYADTSVSRLTIPNGRSAL